MAPAKEEVKAAPAVPAATQKPTAEPSKDVLSTYYVGLTEACPLDFITVPTIAHEGAPTFQKFTQKLSESDGNGIAHLSERMHGGFIKLFPDEVVAIKKYIAEHGLLWLSKVVGEIRVDIVRLVGEGAFKRSRREDVVGNIDPLGKYMYITSAKISAEDREASLLPPTLLQEEEALASK
jgi:hypothetical protein